MISPDQFRADLPEFTDNTVFPTPIIQAWLTFAYAMLNASRWGAQLDWAAEQMAAHNIVLHALAQRAVDIGGLPGLARGTISSESAAGVLSGFATGETAAPGAGHWNYTVYGQVFIRYARLFGAGPIQISGCSGGLILGYAGPPIWNLAWYN